MHHKETSESGKSLVKGALAGLAAGLVASAVMNQFQKITSPAITGERRSHGAQSLQDGSPEHGFGKELAEDGLDDPTDDAAERLANAINVAAVGRRSTIRARTSAERFCTTATGPRWERSMVWLPRFHRM